jgi:pyridoxine 5-phosphate synthase
MTSLSLNINKVATLRNARGGNIPNVVNVALDCERFGAKGITVHPRPDERHITHSDVFELKKSISTEFNIEGYPSKQFLKTILEVNPEQCTLVPDSPDVLTSNQGWDTIKHKAFLKDAISELKTKGVRVSLFMENNLKNIDCAKEVNADRIELYTGPYADSFMESKESSIEAFIKAAEHAREIGLDINAGHDLSLINLPYLIEKIPFIKEVSIGHALICDAIYYGLENTIQMYLRALKPVNVFI